MKTTQKRQGPEISETWPGLKQVYSKIEKVKQHEGWVEGSMNTYGKPRDNVGQRMGTLAKTRFHHPLRGNHDICII